MKTKKFLMTSLLVMGMIIAKAANGFPPELVLVSQPVLTYNANSVTVYYDVQNIGDYTYRGNVYIYLDPDDGYYYAKKYVRVCPGRIKRIAISIPAYRPNPSWMYTVMPYYEIGDELFSFTTFEYFEPVRFCWYGYRNEPWVVIKVGPRPRYYHRPGNYRYYYDGYRPMMPPPPPGAGPDHHPHDLPPMNPAHHTYGYHHSNGGYPANYHPDVATPGYNHNTEPSSGATVHPHGSNASSLSTPGTNNSSNNSGAVESLNRPATTNRPSSSSSSSSSSNSNVSRPSSSSSSSSARPSSNGSSTSNRTGSSSSSSSSRGRNDSSNVSRPSSSSSNNSGTSARPSSNSSSNSGRSGNSSSSSTSSSSNRGSSSSSRSGSNTSSNSGRTPSGSSRTR
ncbi:MAG: hypothetical protein IKT08_02180 [Bacteroidales bacterium]|nr:hypothetical protein [Bacteroidales bacterium]